MIAFLRKRLLVIGIVLVLSAGLLGWFLRPLPVDSLPPPLIDATTDYAIESGER